MAEINARIETGVFGLRMVCFPGHRKVRFVTADGDYLVARRFDRDLNLCRLAEAELSRRGLWGQYVAAFEQDIDEGMAMGASRDSVLIGLTPAQRTDAMLAVIEANHE